MNEVTRVLMAFALIFISFNISALADFLALAGLGAVGARVVLLASFLAVLAFVLSDPVCFPPTRDEWLRRTRSGQGRAGQYDGRDA